MEGRCENGEIENRDLSIINSKGSENPIKMRDPSLKNHRETKSHELKTIFFHEYHELKTFVKIVSFIK